MSDGPRPPIPRRVVVLEGDVVRRALLQAALPPGFEASFATHLGEVGDAEVALVGPRPGGSLEEVCRTLRARMALVLFDERYADAELGRREALGHGAGAFVGPPFSREGLVRAVAEASHRRTIPPAARKATKPPIPGAGATVDLGEAPPTPERIWELFRERVEAIYRNLDRLDHYQVLEISAQSAAPQVKQAYELRLMEFHPDRFASHPSEDFRRKLYEITKAVTLAYKVLSHPAARAAYDAERRTRDRPSGKPVRPRR